MNKSYLSIVLFLCGLSVGNLFAAAPARTWTDWARSLFPGAAAAIEGRLGQQLIDAVKAGKEEEVKELIARGAAVNAINGVGRTTLMLAAHGHTDIIELLLQAGANVNTKDMTGHTALAYAAWRGDADIVQKLLDAGAKKDIKNWDKQTAENEARENHHEDLANMIRDYEPSSGRGIKYAGKTGKKNEDK